MGPEKLAAVGERVGEMSEGAFVVSTADAFKSWPVVISASGGDVLTLTPGTLQRPIFPAETMEIDVVGDSQLTIEFWRLYTHR